MRRGPGRSLELTCDRLTLLKKCDSTPKFPNVNANMHNFLFKETQ